MGLLRKFFYKESESNDVKVKEGLDTLTEETSFDKLVSSLDEFKLERATEAPSDLNKKEDVNEDWIDETEEIASSNNKICKVNNLEEENEMDIDKLRKGSTEDFFASSTKEEEKKNEWEIPKFSVDTGDKKNMERVTNESTISYDNSLEDINVLPNPAPIPEYASRAGVISRQCSVERDTFNSNDNAVVITNNESAGVVSIAALDINPKQLGLPENAKIDFYKDVMDQFKPIIIDDLVDKTGNLSKKVEISEDRLGCSVIPLRFAGIKRNVASLSRHKLLTIDGYQYASGTTRIVNIELFNRIKEDIISALQEDSPYKLSLLVSRNINGENVRTYLLNEYEIRALSSLFVNYHPIRYTTGDSNYFLEINNPALEELIR